MTTDLRFERTTSEARPGFDEASESENTEPSETAIAAIREEGERIKERELERLCRELDATADTAEKRRALEDLADAIVARILAVPIASLRDASADDRAIETATQLFDPTVEIGDGRARPSNGDREVGNGD